MTDTPPPADEAVLEALAAACGYHEGPNCEHCADTLTRVRAKGMTDRQILADLELFRIDHSLWADLTRLRIELERAIPERVALAYTSLGVALVDDDSRHIIELRTDGWTIKHPLACRLGDLFGCRVNLAAEALTGPPGLPGRYECSVDSIDGQLRIGDRVDPVEG